MESLLLSVNVTLPLFIMMALGYVLRCLKVVDNSLLMKINTLNFKVFLPISMFNNIYSSNIQDIWDTKTVAIAA
ncbi:MAG: AEC family transporter, partial [Clostridia bacterium]|nr:AEC family transporter [Clostridia bacterium]